MLDHERMVKHPMIIDAFAFSERRLSSKCDGPLAKFPLVGLLLDWWVFICRLPWQWQVAVCSKAMLCWGVLWEILTPNVCKPTVRA